MDMVEEKVQFEDLKLNRQLLNAIEEAGYTSPTPIQVRAIPLVLAGHDLLGIAQTGTGKTAAFVLPILMKIKYAQGMHPRALILAPTRELVIQITTQVEALSRFTDLRHVALYGGKGPKEQLEVVAQGVDILIATPGRFMDIYLTGELTVKELKVMVLDEADKMMDMGFMPQIRRILEVIPRKRQNLLFSATMPDKVVHLSEEFLAFPERAEVAPQASVVDKIEQELYEVPNLKTKINLLDHLFASNKKMDRVIIFVKTKQSANQIHHYFDRKLEEKVRLIHGNKGQNTRLNAMDDFREGNVRVLVTTDVVARGIDVTDVSHVINFDVPLVYEDYVHRIGRTGRANKEGKAITLCNPAELYHIGKIEKLIGMPIPRRKIPRNVEIPETSKEETKAMAREIDFQKRKENPEYKGAFHEKKKHFPAKKKSSFKPGKPKSKKGGRGRK